MRHDYYTNTEADAGRWQAAHGESDFNPRDELTAEENGEDERRRAGR